MIHLSRDIEVLAKELAASQQLPVETAIRRALETAARAHGLSPAPRRRMTVDQMLALGAEITALPLRDQRTPNDIMDDLNSL